VSGEGAGRTAGLPEAGDRAAATGALASVSRGAARMAGALWRFILRVWDNLRWRRAKAVWRLANSVLARFNRDDGSAMAGYIAYAGFLALFPFAIFATALAGTIVGPRDTQDVTEALLDLAPAHVAQTVAPVLSGVTDPRAGVLTLSAAGALWAASNAVEAIRVAFDRAYGVKTPRGFVARRGIGLGFVVLATGTFALLGFLIILAPLAIDLASRYLGADLPVGVGLLRYGIAGGALLLFLFELNLLLPSKRPPRRRLWPGIYVSAALAIAGAYAFSVYLSYAPSYTVTYGALAGVIVTLLFFYLTGAAIILGAHVNATLMAFRRPTARDRAD
jgi:membrane protein